MRAVSWIGVITVAATLIAQTPPTVIRTTTRFVQVRVMVEDTGGKAVTDLRREEFQLQDNRQPQLITSFSFEGDKGIPDAGRRGATPQSSDQVRDDFAVILLDWLNPRYADRIAVRDSVMALLRRFQPRQKVALFVLGRTTRMLHDFTSDPAELVDVLAEQEPEPEDPFDPARPALLDERMKTWASLPPEQRLSAFEAKIVDTLGALQKLSDRLSRRPGRKSLIWATNGFPMIIDERAVPGLRRDTISYLSQVESLIRSLNRANIALYMLDARGLRAEIEPLQPYADIATLTELSSRTGGSIFTDRNDLAEGMRMALEDGLTSYTLGFNVPEGAKPGLHEISLRTTRPGLKLRYRRNYQLDAVAPGR